ncbi:hypothetical protein BB561_002839 [Smittium simulii]|uniref:Uncharacterized protein n=1 Tax=Smittium simulii TaxID=133385 RepID=A0A2T9YNZ2_9FUNG|nr:hypothetical protein BB561_002839 [Smittium simulii]
MLDKLSLLINNSKNTAELNISTTSGLNEQLYLIPKSIYEISVFLFSKKN